MGLNRKLVLFGLSTALWFGAVLGMVTLAHADGASSQSDMIRVDSPRSNDQLTSGTVDVRYQRLETSTSAPAASTFRIQLDAGDPITTEHTTCLLTGLTPGPHSLSVALVDPAGASIPRSLVSVKFMVLPAARHDDSLTPAELVASQGPPLSPEGRNPNSRALPILSIIGFGVLVGGIFSAMRTR